MEPSFLLRWEAATHWVMLSPCISAAYFLLADPDGSTLPAIEWADITLSKMVISQFVQVHILSSPGAVSV
jgi:hypothetical protein